MRTLALVGGLAALITAGSAQASPIPVQAGLVTAGRAMVQIRHGGMRHGGMHGMGHRGMGHRRMGHMRGTGHGRMHGMGHGRMRRMHHGGM